ncbi:MAG TPA: hypothetical protein VGL75_07420 [Acidothermaceae bacterium]|jgi:hypothetical protein
MAGIDLRTKALGYLRRGDVEVSDVRTVADNVFVTAVVKSHVPGRAHIVDGHVEPDGSETWRCTCPKYLDPTCAHRAAVQLVTGGKTEIRPELGVSSNG